MLNLFVIYICYETKFLGFGYKDREILTNRFGESLQIKQEVATDLAKEGH